jgi:fibronectin-binding autotransporter adhesin
MKKILQIAVLILCVSSLARAQQKQSLSAAAATCTTTGTSCLITSVDPQAGGVTITVTTNASGNTLQFEASGDGGTTWVALNATPSNSTTAATSTTSTGTWQANIAAYTNVRIRMSTLVGGTSTVSIIYSIASARAGGGGGGNGTGINYVTTNPGTSTAGQTFFNTTTHQLLCASATNTLVDCIRDNGGFNTIYAGSPEYGGKFDGKYELDCTIAASTTMTCPSANFIITDVGKSGMGTTYIASAPASPSGTVICFHSAVTTPTTIAALISSTQVTLGDACSTSCTPVTGLVCAFGWYTQPDDPALALAQTAAWVGVTQCKTLVLPNVPIYVKNGGLGSGSASAACESGIDSNQAGPELMGLGMLGSVVIPTLDFNFASCTGGGTSGTSGSSCFGGVGDLVAHDFSIWGMGVSLPTTTHAVNIFDLNGSNTFYTSAPCAGSTARNMRISQWLSQSTSSVGFNIEGSCDSDVSMVTVQQGGQTECRIQTNAGIGGTIVGFSSVGCFGCPVACLNLTGGGQFASSGGFYGGMESTGGADLEFANGSPYIASFSGDSIFTQNPQTNVFAILANGAGVTNLVFSGDVITTTSTNGAGSHLIQMGAGSGSSISLYGSKLVATGANNNGFQMSAGNAVLDSCANTYAAGTNADVFTGGVFGSCSITGTSITAAKLVLSGGWGTTAAWTSLTGGTQYVTGTITASGTGQGASPTITYTFPTPFWTTPAGCYASQVGGTQVAVAAPFTPSALSATGVTFTYNSLPVAGNTLFVQIECWNP